MLVPDEKTDVEKEGCREGGNDAAGARHGRAMVRHEKMSSPHVDFADGDVGCPKSHESRAHAQKGPDQIRLDCKILDRPAKCSSAAVCLVHRCAIRITS